jgi:transposase
VLIVEDWAEIRRLRRSEGVSISEIARVVGCSWNTVKAALASDGPPRYERASAAAVLTSGHAWGCRKKAPRGCPPSGAGRASAQSP